MRILKTTDPAIAISAFDSVDGNLDEFLLWLDENIPKEYSGKDLSRAYDKISRADVFRGRIRRWQYWGYLRYINVLLTAGIAVAKDQKKPGTTQYKRNSRILKIWMANRKYAKRKSIAQKLGAHCHCSYRKALQFLPLLKPAINEDLALELGLDEEELGWLHK
jgi:replication factor C large subunit